MQYCFNQRRIQFVARGVAMKQNLPFVQEQILNSNGQQYAANTYFRDPQEELEAEEIDKKLKVLEIIKNSVVATPNIPIIKTPAGEFIEITLAITKEQYELLKEVLL